jgi:hypothetical protein
MHRGLYASPVSDRLRNRKKRTAMMISSKKSGLAANRATRMKVQHCGLETNRSIKVLSDEARNIHAANLAGG